MLLTSQLLTIYGIRCSYTINLWVTIYSMSYMDPMLKILYNWNMLLTSQLLLKILVESPRPAEKKGATGVAWNWAAVLAFRAGHPWDRLDITENPWKTKGKPWKTGGKHRKPRLNFEQHQIFVGNIPWKSWDVTNHNWDLTDHVPGVIRVTFICHSFLGILQFWSGLRCSSRKQRWKS